MFKFNYPQFWYNKNIIACLLWLPSKLYFILGVIRHYFAKPITFPAPVICVGNASVGGTGKTQIVIWLTKLLQAQNISSVVITKAYKSQVKTALLVHSNHRSIDVGDESLMIAQYTRVIAAAQIKHAMPLVESLKPDIIIVDDGMQNPNFTKDFVILAVDGLRGFGNNWLLPAGSLRQYPSSAFDMADAVIVLEGDSNTNLQKIMRTCNKPIFNAKNLCASDLDKTIAYFAFSGIGNPDRFLSTLKYSGLKVVGFEIFPDHHHYSDKDCKYLQVLANDLNATLITTSKDYIKVHDRLAVKNFEVELLINNAKTLQNLIYAKILKKNQTSS